MFLTLVEGIYCGGLKFCSTPTISCLVVYCGGLKEGDDDTRLSKEIMFKAICNSDGFMLIRCFVHCGGIDFPIHLIPIVEETEMPATFVCWNRTSSLRS